MNTIVYLNFDGNAKEALEFYSGALNANKVKKVKFEDIPQDPNYPLPTHELDMIMESSIEFAHGKLMISDILPSMQVVTGKLVKGNNVLISLVIDDKHILKEYFEKLSSGGKVLMPLSSVPWSSCFGLLVDKYGVSWKFNSDADKFLNTIINNKQ